MAASASTKDFYALRKIFGGPSEDRTRDLLLAEQALSQTELSAHKIFAIIAKVLEENKNSYLASRISWLVVNSCSLVVDPGF